MGTSWKVRNGLALDWPQYSKGKYDGAQRDAEHAAVRMTGVPRSDDGTVLTRWTIASRNDASLTPQGSSMGSGKRLSQDTTQLRKESKRARTRSEPRCLIDGGARARTRSSPRSGGRLDRDRSSATRPSTLPPSRGRSPGLLGRDGRDCGERASRYRRASSLRFRRGQDAQRPSIRVRRPRRRPLVPRLRRLRGPISVGRMPA